MNNKEYGVKLDVDISKFTSKLNTAKTYTDQVMEEIKNRIQEPMEEVGKASKSSFTGRLETVGELSAQLAKLTVDYANVVATEGKQSQSAIDLKEKIRALKKEIENEGQALEKIGDDLNDLFEDEQQATDGMKKFGDEVVKVKNKGQGITTIFARFGDDVSGSIKKGVSSIKRFTLSLLGIRGAYTILTRAVNSYMSQDKDMYTRLQANWIALGSILAPVVERLISLFQKLVAYINIFVKAFAGDKVDLLSKAMKVVEKNTKKTTKAVKSLSKELGTLDEIENLNFDQGGGDIDAGGGFEIADALKEIQNIKLNPKVVKFFEDLGKNLRDLTDKVLPFLQKHFWGIINTLITFWGLFKIMKLVEFISQIKNLTSAIGISGGLGLVGAFSLLIGVITGFVSEVAKGEKEVADRVKKIKDTATQTEELENAKEREKELYEDVETAIDNQIEAQKNLQQVEKEVGLSGEDIYNKVKNNEIAYRDLTDEQRKVYKAYKEYKKSIDELNKKEKEHTESVRQIKKEEFDVRIANDKTGESYQQLKEEIIKAWENGELTTKQATDSINNMTAGMSAQQVRIFRNDLPDAINDGLSPSKYRSTLQQLGDIFTEKFKSIAGKVGGILGTGVKDGLLKEINNIPVGVEVQKQQNTIIGATIKTKFAKGNVAYQPTMAEFGEYAGARSNPEITAPQNMMRETLFEALSEALPLVGKQGGDTVLYVNGRELARATYQDYQAEGNRLGNSSVAVRRVS